jgi:hypothetical protein
MTEIPADRPELVKPSETAPSGGCFGYGDRAI